MAGCCAVLWGGGNREGNESRTAGDPAGFTDSIDITDKKSGKYNYYLEAKDKAGNIMLAGPDNIYIDPASDLPMATIINPLPNMRVQGNLNIVGIAVDDDGVDHVEFAVSRGNDGRGEEIIRVQAQGSDYWSYFLDTTNTEVWTDGVYTITAWAVDIKGLAGISEDFQPKVRRMHQVYWNLDRKKPETLVTSHEIGALVSGKIRMRGVAKDGNGINSLGYSVDGGERYTPVRVNLDKRTGDYSWEINLATNTFDDGPAVIWFQARDGQGTLGTAAHLLFVNNTGPDVKIVSPLPEETVNGIFTVAGYSAHPVGLRSVSWKLGKDGGDIEMLTGNPWWSADIDIRGLKTNSIEVEIRAVDVSGNVSTVKQKYRVDQNADLPIVTLQEPTAGAFLDEDGNIIVKGSVRDDDGVSSVFYSLNSGPQTEIPSSGYFQFIIPNVPGGTHTLDVWAKDITGVTGPKVQVKNITAPGRAAEIKIASLTNGSGNNAVTARFYTGMTVRLEPKVRTAMEITVDSAFFATASVTFGTLPAIQIRPAASRGETILRANVQVPANLLSGYTKIELRATDRSGRETVYEEFVFIAQNDPAIATDSSNTERFFNWIRANITENGQLFMGGYEEVLIGLGHRPLRSATVTGEGAENIYVGVDEYGRALLQARNEGSFGPFLLTLENMDYDTYYSDYFYVISDFYGPKITMREEAGGWVQTSVPVSFNLSGTNMVKSVEYSLDLGLTWLPLISNDEISLLRAPVNTEISRVLDVSGIEDGSICVLIKAVNAAGVSSTENFTVFKDTQAPTAELIMPITEARVNGTIRMGFSIKEAGKLKSVTYKRPASSEPQKEEINTVVYWADGWNKDYSVMFLEVLMDSLLMPLDENMRFVFEDEAGNTSEVYYWQFIIDNEMDIPVAHIILPLDNEVISTDFIVSGVMFDDDAIKQIYWKIDDNYEQIVVAENGFSIPIPLSSLTDNEHTVTVVAEDIYGVKSEPVTRGFRVSLSEPAAAITFPSFDTILRDVIRIEGTSFDENGIERLHVSLDNGNSYNIVYGTEEWSYTFNSKILKDGPNVVFFRVWDKYEISATYSAMINVDNTPPEIILDSPGDGSISIGKVSIMGRVIDPNLDIVSIEFRSLEGAAINENIRSRNVDIASTIVKETLDLTGQTDGLYNVEVVGTDKAGNITRISRNVELARESMKNFVEILYPLDNENVQGTFNLYGYTGGTDPAGSVTIRINGIDSITTLVEESGYYRFSLDPENLYSGVNTIMVHSTFGGYESIESRTQHIYYKADGPWVTVDSFNIGDFAFERPYLYGRTGYTLSEEDTALLADRSTPRQQRADIQAKTPSLTEISFDNGKTFVKAGTSLTKGIDYRYRLETGDMTEGMHYLLVRASMKNGETAVTRMLVQVDKTPPVIRLISPEAGGRYNEEIAYSASATDDVELESIIYYLRRGDKSSYEIPGFIQGLYFEGIVPPFIRQINNNVPIMPLGGGATYMDVGFGLSFFDDNVKIQAQYGFMTQKIYEQMGGIGPVRYGGHVLGIKLLASIYSLPFGSFAGPDWEWLSASFALGANFSLFDLAQEGYTQSGKSTWMSAILMQIEFPKVTIPKRKYLRTFSLFTEGQLWFVPTDVDAEALGIDTVIPHIIMGLRLYIF